MFPRKWLFAALTLCVIGFSQGQSIDSRPSDATGEIGGTATFNCRITFGAFEEMTWEFDKKIIYSFLDGLEEYPAGRSKYSVARDGSNFTLVVKDLSFEDGGIYTCAAFAPTADAVLVVLGTPSLTIQPPDPVEGDSVIAVCEASFGGPEEDSISPEHLPHLEMFKNGLPLKSLNIEVMNNQLRKLYNATAGVSLDGTELACEIRKQNPVMSLNTSPAVINVLYSVRNISISPHEDIMEIGSSLTCNAVGNPTPIFKWINDEKPEQVVNDRFLDITEDMVGRNRWRCTARNTIKEEVHEESATVVFEVDTPENGYGVLTFVIVGVVVGILVVLGIVIWKFRGRMLSCMADCKNSTRDDEEFGLRETDPLKKHKGESVVDSNKKCMEFMDLLELLHTKEDMDSNGYRILSMAQQNKEGILESDPDIYLKVVKKANKLIASHHYRTLIENLTDVDDWRQSRSKCLLALTCQAEYISESEDYVEWTSDFLNLLKFLLQKGADPTWIHSDDLQKLERKDRYTAQDRFFSVVFNVLPLQQKLFDELENLIIFFLSGTSGQLKDVRGTALHAVLQVDWIWLNNKITNLNDLKKNLNDKQKSVDEGNESSNNQYKSSDDRKKSWNSDFFQQYKQIISTVKQNDPNSPDKTDWCGRTPLHLFFQGIQLDKVMFTNVVDIVELLTSETSLNAQDTTGRSVLHYVAQAFVDFASSTNLDLSNKRGKTFMPSLPTVFGYFPNILQKEDPAFLDLVRKVRTPVNSGLQDKDKCTALHILANKNVNISENLYEVLVELIKLFTEAKSNVDIADNQGNTVLHIMADKYPQVPSHGVKTFLVIMKHLTSCSSGKVQNIQGQTVLHRLANSYAANMPTYIQENFLEMVRLSGNESNFDAKDNNGCTALHLFTAKFPKEIPDHGVVKFLDVIKHLASHSDKTIQDCRGHTVLHKIVQNYAVNMPEHLYGQFLPLVKNLGDKSNTDFQDEKGMTALHILAEKYPLDIPEKGPETFVKVMGHLTSCSSKIIQDSQGYTFLHLILRNFSKDMPDSYQSIFFELVRQSVTKANADVVDNEGYAALHTLIKKYPKDVSEERKDTFLKAVDHIANLSDKDKQDKQGCTALHILVNNYDQKTPPFCKGVFHWLVEILKSNINVNLPDEQGHTALHTLTKTIANHPESGHGLLPTIELLTTTENVNLPDQLSITPYSWILHGKPEWENYPEFVEIFSGVEALFHKNKADNDAAARGQKAIQEQERNVAIGHC